MAQTQKRRDFLKTSMLAGLGVALAGRPLLSAYGARPDARATAFYGYGGLTAIAVIDDCARLLRHARGTSEVFRQVLERNVDLERPGNVALTACLVRASKSEIIRLVGRCRERWPERGGEAVIQSKLAFALGWLAHRAAREQFEPLYDEASDAPPGYPSEMSIYHDAAVLRGRSLRPFSEGETGGSEEQAGTTELLFQEFGARMLIRFHTFVPDDDLEGWISRLALWRGEKEALFRRLAQAYQAPDPEKVRRYVREPNVYDENDELIRLARALQEGDASSPGVEEAIEEAIEKAPEGAATQSHYARALRRGCRNLRAADDYFRANADGSTLMDRIP